MSHTPGPWKVGQSGDPVKSCIGLTDGYCEDTCILTADNREVMGCSEWMRVSEADAQLIAAAPDLLAALKRLHEVGLVREWNTPENKAAIAAIAKAEGRA